MASALTARTALILCVAPLLWAGNAIVGRLAAPLISPMLLNALRWALACAILLPLGLALLRHTGGLRSHWRRFLLLGFLSVGAYNALQYLALRTSSPLNVTLVASSAPAMMLLVGRLCFGQAITARQMVGTVFSMLGVLCVLLRGEWARLGEFQIVLGDLYVLIATVGWAFYSWLLVRGGDPPGLRAHWAAFLLAQVLYGLIWSGLFAGGEAWAGLSHAAWGLPLLAVLVYVAVGPSVLAYRAWTRGVELAGPAVAAFFANLTPIFAALLSATWLGEWPQPYHALGFACVLGGIVISSRAPR